jgi:hypothetical protein
MNPNNDDYGMAYVRPERRAYLRTLDRPWVQGSATSYAAADSMRDTAANKRMLVLTMIRVAGIHGLTRDEIADMGKMNPSTVRPRVAELMARGLIAVSDEVRRTASGRSAEVLVAR